MSALVALGLGMSMVSKFMENQDAARAEAENADSLWMQAQRSREVYARKFDLLMQNQTQFKAIQAGRLAKAGVSMQGSALDFAVQSDVEMLKEQVALKSEAAFDEALLVGEAKRAEARAANYSNWQRTLLSIGGQGLTGAANYRAAQGKG